MEEIYQLFSAYDLAVLTATVVGVRSIVRAFYDNPELGGKVKYPRLATMGLTFVVTFIGLFILYVMGEHTLAEVFFLTFVFGLAGEQIYYRGREAVNGGGKVPE